MDGAAGLRYIWSATWVVKSFFQLILTGIHEDQALIPFLFYFFIFTIQEAELPGLNQQVTAQVGVYLYYT